ncbi:MAG: winged helix-turn-helix domain-containing protein [Thermoplasmatota archaeon]
MSARKYKDMNLYSCIVLNLLASALQIDLTQKDIENKLGPLIDRMKEGLSKSEIMHAIRSNHNMTEKILNHLVDEGYIKVDRTEKSYQIYPTEEGMMHVRDFNKFYASIYAKQIEEHYKYIGLPAWYRRHRN